MSIEEKWVQVKAYYERAYKIGFKEKPPPLIISYLFNQMKKLQGELQEMYEQKPFLERNYRKQKGLAIDPTQKRGSDE